MKKLTENVAKRQYLDFLKESEELKALRLSLLDSSLITQTHFKKYTIKLIRVGEYFQLYYFNKIKLKKDNNLEKNKDVKLIDNDFLIKKENYQKNPEKKVIDEKNINRSKFAFQRLVKANEKKWKTFITLTFSENVDSIKEANKKFNAWRTKIKSIKKDFSYIGVPEYQKRGAVHYHILTNLEIKQIYKYMRRGKLRETLLIIPQENFSEKQLAKMSVEKRKKCYDVKYWPHGFTSVFPVENINVVGYMSKYMTKSSDNRLFGQRRYFYSQNLDRPEEHYLDLSNDDDFTILADILANNVLSYENSYLDAFGDVIDFVEYKKN